RSSGSAADQRGPGGRHPGRVRVPQPERPDEGRVRAGREPLRGPGVRSSYSFSNDVLYQIKIDNTGNAEESLVIQARFEGYESFRDPRCATAPGGQFVRSEEHTSELQSRFDLVCRLLLEKKKKLT